MLRYVIVGDGAAGTTAARMIREKDPTGLIEIYADDPNPAYFRAALTNYLIGELREDQIWAVPPTFYSEYRVRRYLSPVRSIDFERSQVLLDRDGRSAAYDRLLIATGSRPRPASFENSHLPGVMTMRTLQDVRAVMDKIKLQGLKNAVVIGGGPLALEWAQGMHERGVHVTILLRGKRFMPGSLDATGSDLLMARLRHGGITVLDEEEAETAIAGPNGAVSAIRTKTGKTVPCDLVGVAIGVIPNTEFLKGSPLEIDRRGAVVVDNRLRTNLPNVYAGGDVAVVAGQLLQLWEPARWHGRIAGLNMAGGNETYRPGTPYVATRLFDLDFASVGRTEAGEGEEELVHLPTGTGSITYRKAVLKDGVVVGALMLGERKEGVRRQGRALKDAVDRKADVSDVKDRLLAPFFDLRGWLSKSEQLEKPVQVESLHTMVNIHRSQLIKMPVAGLLGAQEKEKKKSTSLPAAELRDEAKAKVYKLGATTRIGRAPDNDIVPNDTQISRYHAEVRLQGELFFVHDLKSSNGTFVNDQRVTSSMALHPGSVVRIGETRLMFHVAEPVREPAAPVNAGPATIIGTRTAVFEPVKEEPRHLMTVGLATQAFKRISLVSEPEVKDAYIDQGGRQVPITTQTVLIGREKSNDVVIDDQSVSHIHAQISRHGDEYYLQDLGSRNGSWANGQQISVPHKLGDGDQLRFGLSELVFRLGTAQPQQAAEVQEAPPVIEPPAPEPIVQPEIPVRKESAPSEMPTAFFGTPAAVTPSEPENREQPAPVVEEPVPEPAETAAAVPAAPKRVFESTALGCPNCGEMVSADAEVCSNCGKVLREPAPQSEPAPAPAPAPEPILVASLEMKEGSAEGGRFILDTPTVVIGRDADQCDFAIDNGTISRQHAEITETDGSYRLKDMGSRNGTFLNGKQIASDPIELKDGDEIGIGKQVTLVFHHRQESEPDFNATIIDL